MKTQVAETSIQCFYGSVQEFAPSQNERVMAVIKPGRDYSLCELMALTTYFDELGNKHVIDKSSISRVVNTLRKKTRLFCGEKRKCTISGEVIKPSRLPVPEDFQFALVLQ